MSLPTKVMSSIGVLNIRATGRLTDSALQKCILYKVGDRGRETDPWRWTFKQSSCW